MTTNRQKIFFVPEEIRQGIVEDVFECLNNLGYVWHSGDQINDFSRCFTSTHFMDVVYAHMYLPMSTPRKAFLELSHGNPCDVVFCDDIEECEEVYYSGDWVSAEEFLKLNNYSSQYSAKQFTVGEEFDNVNNLF